MSTAGKPKGEIQLADLIKALCGLPWQDEAQAQAIAGCLGFGLSAPRVQQPRPGTTIYDPKLTRPKSTSTPSATKSSLAMPPAPSLPVTLPANVLQSTLTSLPQRTPASASQAADWLEEEYQILQPAAGLSPARQPLLPDTLARGVFGAALATLRAGNEPDIPELVRRVVQGRIPPRLPCVPAATLAHGCQLLLDFSETMLPWWDDLRGLAQQLVHVIGTEAVTVFDFDKNPTTATRWLANGDEQPWRPEPGRPILLATDFGIQGARASRPAPAYWTDFIAQCASRGRPLVILVPWPRVHWPEGLGAYPGLMHWHPRTSAAMVRRKLGRGHRVRP